MRGAAGAPLALNRVPPAISGRSWRSEIASCGLFSARYVKIMIRRGYFLRLTIARGIAIGDAITFNELSGECRDRARPFSRTTKRRYDALVCTAPGNWERYLGKIKIPNPSISGSALELLGYPRNPCAISSFGEKFCNEFGMFGSKKVREFSRCGSAFDTCSV